MLLSFTSLAMAVRKNVFLYLLWHFPPLEPGYEILRIPEHKRTVHLYQGRYKSILVQKKSYLHVLSRYIHLNQVRTKQAGKLPLTERSVFPNTASQSSSSTDFRGFRYSMYGNLPPSFDHRVGNSISELTRLPIGLLARLSNESLCQVNYAFGDNRLPTKHSKKHEKYFATFASFRGQLWNSKYQVWNQ